MTQQYILLLEVLNHLTYKIMEALAAVGADFSHVVKITNYFVDMAHLQTFFEVRDRFVHTEAPPASTAVQVVKLARPEALFEIEAIAVVPQG